MRSIVLNAGGDPSRFARFGLDVIADGMPDQPGPLAGILASLEDTARRAPDASHVLTVPCDTPFLPLDLASRLAAAAGPDAIAVAASEGRLHHVTALWPVALAGALRAAMSVEGSRRVEAFAARHNLVAVSFDGPDPFFNVNTPADLLVAEARAGAAQSVMAEGGIMGRSGSRDETKD